MLNNISRFRNLTIYMFYFNQITTSIRHWTWNLNPDPQTTKPTTITIIIVHFIVFFVMAKNPERSKGATDTDRKKIHIIIGTWHYQNHSYPTHIHTYMHQHPQSHSTHRYTLTLIHADKERHRSSQKYIYLLSQARDHWVMFNVWVLYGI